MAFFIKQHMGEIIKQTAYYLLNIYSIPQNYYQNVGIRFDISLAINKIVMKVTYECMMTSSDQILRIF